MPEYRHPRTLDGVDGHPPARVNAPRGNPGYVVSDGTFEAPERVGRELADAYGVDVSAMRVGDETETCETVKSDGEVCGRELPCRFHSD